MFLQNMSRWGSRVCAACGVDLDESSFSTSQWAKGVGISRCQKCVCGSYDVDSAGFGAARESLSTEATVGYKIYATGAFRNVYLGTYTEGKRKGQKCVSKEFKTGCVFQEDFFKYDIDAVNKALHIITQFNQAKFVNGTIKLNIPSVWSYRHDGSKSLVEPYIEGYQKYNSNTGWVAPHMSGWSDVMQALSHYSYHVSSGMFVLCDLQGGICNGGVVLTDPVIHSRTRKYGVTDLGAEGIETFFSVHTCNAFCEGSWTRPRVSRQFFTPTSSTSMLKHKHVTDAKPYRPGMTAIDEYDEW